MAGVSLLVGGIGMISIMLANVLERRRETGLLRAIGARRHDIVVRSTPNVVSPRGEWRTCGVASGARLTPVVFFQASPDQPFSQQRPLAPTLSRRGEGELVPRPVLGLAL